MFFYYRVKNVLFIWFLLRYLRRGIRQIRGRGVLGTCAAGYVAFKRWACGRILSLPWYKSRIKLEFDQAMKKLEDKLVPKGAGVTRYLALPTTGWTEQEVKAELQKYVNSALAGMYGN